MHAHISAAAEPCTVSCFNNCMSKVTFDTHSVLLDRYMEVCVSVLSEFIFMILNHILLSYSSYFMDFTCLHNKSDNNHTHFIYICIKGYLKRQ